MSGEVLEVWRTVELADIAKLSMGETLLSKNLTGNGLPVFSANTDDGPWGFTNNNRRRLRRGDIVIGARGSIGFPRRPAFDAFTCTQTTIAVEPDRDVVDSEYLHHALCATDILGIASQQAIPMLTIGSLSPLEVALPSLDEQRRIAEVLRSVDEAIAAADLALVQTNRVRQAALDGLLFRGPEQGGLSREQYLLSELISIAHGFAFKSEYFTANRDDPILLTPGNFSVGKTLYFGERTKHYSGPIPDGYVLEHGSLVVVMTDLTQDMAILGNAVEINAGPVVLHNQRIGRVSLLKPDLITKGYVRLLLNSGSVQAQIKATASGSTVRHTAPSRILECKVQLPPLDEQAKIVEVAKSLDDIVIAEERRRSDVEAAGPLAHLRDLKAKIANDLLSGHIRVPA